MREIKFKGFKSYIVTKIGKIYAYYIINIKNDRLHGIGLIFIHVLNYLLIMQFLLRLFWTFAYAINEYIRVVY